MKDANTEKVAPDLVFEYKLEASPEKVWRAITLPAYRNSWLPEAEPANVETVSTEPDSEIRLRMRETAPPFLESIVTFQVEPDANGGTILRIVHELTDALLSSKVPQAANSNEPLLMRAA